MAKVTITITDLPGDKVEVICDPTFETMAKMNESGHPWTSAHGYALRALNAIRKAGKEKEPTLIHIPKLGIKF